MGSTTSGKETQPTTTTKTSGGALAVAAVIQCWETAGGRWWQPIIHRLQQDAGLGELRGGEPQKGQAWWDSSVLRHHSSAERDFGGPGLPWAAVWFGGRWWQETWAPLPALPPACTSPWQWLWGLNAECCPPLLDDKQGSKNIFHGYRFSCWARIASAAMTSWERWEWVQTTWMALARLAPDVHCAELMALRAPRSFQIYSWLVTPSLQPCN